MVNDDSLRKVFDQWESDAIEVGVFVGRYRAARKESGAKRPGPTDSRDIGKKLRELCPEIETKKASRPDARQRRPKEFRLPPLESCRNAFERFVGARFNWETGEVRSAGPLTPPSRPLTSGLGTPPPE